MIKNNILYSILWWLLVNLLKPLITSIGGFNECERWSQWRQRMTDRRNAIKYLNSLAIKIYTQMAVWYRLGKTLKRNNRNLEICKIFIYRLSSFFDNSNASVSNNSLRYRSAYKELPVLSISNILTCSSWDLSRSCWISVYISSSSSWKPWKKKKTNHNYSSGNKFITVNDNNISFTLTFLTVICTSRQANSKSSL